MKTENKNQDNTKQEFITKIIIMFDSKKNKILQGEFDEFCLDRIKLKAAPGTNTRHGIFCRQIEFHLR